MRRLRTLASRLFWTLGWDVVGPFISRTFFSALILRTANFTTVRWLGKPILQNTLDLWTIQETLFDLKPALIIETGTNRGGSSYFYAQLFDLMGTGGRIVTIDIARQHDLANPRITYLVGDSTSPPIVDQVGAMASACGRPRGSITRKSSARIASNDCFCEGYNAVNVSCAAWAMAAFIATSGVTSATFE